MKESTRTSPLSMHHEGNLTHIVFPSIVKESTSALQKNTKLHHEGNLACASFPYIPKTNTMAKTTLHIECNLTHDRSHSITSTNGLQ
jgi:hypothetical protein